MDDKSCWTAAKVSDVTLVGAFELSQIDAPAGVTITAKGSEAGTYTLASGGTLILLQA